MTLNFSDLAPLVVFMIPISAVTMFFIALIAGMIFRQRTRERVMRDRIAAIERGADPSHLPTV